MKTTFLYCILFIGVFFSVNAQNTPEQAYTINLQKAKNGDAKAMYAVGLAYRFGMGVSIDLNRAFEFINRAAENGYQDAWYTVAEMYKDGIGIKQDYATAYQIITKKVRQNDYRANAMMAYMLYKGLGCQQNYQTAYQLFYNEAQYGNIGCMYYVGLCLRNGYGVAQNTKEANKWLKKSAAKGDKQSISELEIPQPENYLPPVNNDNTSYINCYGRYKAVQHNVTLDYFDGNYAGILYKYDWSGNYVVEKNSVQLKLTKTETGFEGSLQEDGKVSSITAELDTNGLRFKNSTYTKIDRYSGGKAEPWQITEGKMEVVKEKDSTYLVANIQMYSNDRREPSKPYLLKIAKLQPKNAATKLIGSNKMALAVATDTTKSNNTFAKRVIDKLVRYTVTADSVEIRLFDDGVVDGDEVGIIYNDKLLASKIKLTASPYSIKIPVVKGQVNTFSLYAENLGSIPPVTAFLRILFDGKEAALNISSDFSRNGSIEFVGSKKP